MSKAKRTPTRKKSKKVGAAKKRRPSLASLASLASVARPPVTDTTLLDSEANNGSGKRSARAVAKLLDSGNYRRISRTTKFTPQHVGRVLKGTKGTTLDGAALIAAAGGVTIDELHAYVVRTREKGRREARERLAAIRSKSAGKTVIADASSADQ